MFDLPVSSNTQWAVQLLTYEYLIDGYVDEKQENSNFNLNLTARGSHVNMHVTSARIQPTGILALPGPAPVPWVLVESINLVAVIPRDEASTTFVLKNSANYSKYSIPAELYVGSYLIRGKVLSPEKMLMIFEIYSTFIVQDAEISCRLPGAQLPELTAPYVLVVASRGKLLTPLI